MISGMKEGVVFADVDNRIIEVNDYFCHIMGQTRAGLLGRTLESLHQGPILEKIKAQIKNFRENDDAEPYQLQRSLGESEVIIRVQPIYRDGEYDGVLMNVIDVSELVKNA